MIPPVTFCNELIAAERPRLGDQAALARELGATGLEIAPATLGPAPHRLSDRAVAALRAEVEGEGVQVTGLHWLLSGWPDASIADPARVADAQDRLRGLIALCAGLGGAVLVHGSPRQRAPAAGEDPAAVEARLPAIFAPLAAAAAAAGVVYCLEPLSPAETSVVTSVAAAAAVVEAVSSPAFRAMIDVSAAGQAEPPVADLIARWLPTGLIGHVHLNDTNRGAPGAGDDPFDAILGALAAGGWRRPLSVEPFRLSGDARATFALAMTTIRAHWPEGRA